MTAEYQPPSRAVGDTHCDGPRRPFHMPPDDDNQCGYCGATCPPRERRAYTGVRYPMSQYRAQIILTGDDLGAEALGWLLRTLIEKNTGHLVIVEHLAPLPDTQDWRSALERRVGPTTSYAEARATNPGDHGKTVVRDVLRAVLSAVNSLDSLTPGGGDLGRRDVITAVDSIAERYGVPPGTLRGSL